MNWTAIAIAIVGEIALNILGIDDLIDIALYEEIKSLHSSAISLISTQK